jgi:molybdopterin molybdotransferase
VSAAAVTFEEARQCVLDHSAHLSLPPTELVPLLEARQRVLAEDIAADRDYPAAARSVRDGFAVRASDLPGPLRIVGEVRAGEEWKGVPLETGQALEIMTGAPMPEGADAVIMIEHATRNQDSITADRTLRPGENFNPQGSEAKSGAVVIGKGRRLTFADIALLATVGRDAVAVHPRPAVAILATGDEVVEITQSPESFQVRNSNSYSLAAQVEQAGGCPTIFPVARDVYDHTRALVEQGLQDFDLLLLSGGVSAGKYDIVEKVLADLGAKFYFDRVKIQPGQPLVFGRVGEKLFFGLPGNPASTMVTFEVFAKAVVERLSGIPDPKLPLTWAPLTRDFRHKPGLRRFLPAIVDESRVTPVGWSGSSDVPALARANAFLVADPDKPEYKAGEMIQVLWQ